MLFYRVDFAQENDGSGLLVHNGVQERMVGNERGGVNGGHWHSARVDGETGGGGGFGSIFVHGDVSFMNTIVDLQRLLAHAIEVSLLAENRFQSHFAQGLFQIDLRANLEFGQLNLDLFLFHALDDLSQFFAGQTFFQFFQTVALFGQNDDHRQVLVIVGQFDGLQILFLRVTMLGSFVHELNLLFVLVAAVLVEGLLFGLGFVEGVLPRSLEVDGVGQNHLVVLIQRTFLEQFGHFLLGFLTNPLVDFLTRLLQLIFHIDLLHLGFVALFGRLDVVVFQFQIFVLEETVGDFQFGFLVVDAQLLFERAVDLQNFVAGSGAFDQGAFELFARLTVGAVFQQGQSQGDGNRGHDFVPFLVLVGDGFVEVDGEVGQSLFGFFRCFLGGRGAQRSRRAHGQSEAEGEDHSLE